MIDVSVIIVSWNTKDLLRKCLKSIYDETVKYTFEIIVVDNDSPDKSADMVAEEFPDVILIANKDNKGFAAGNNQAMVIAKGENLLLLNPDTVVIENAIDKMIDYVKTTKYQVVTCKLLNGDMTLQKSVNSFFSLLGSFVENRYIGEKLAKMNTKGNRFMSFWDHSEDREFDWAFGAVIFITREVYEKIGLLDEKFYIYAEEMDYFMRIRKAGYKAMFLSEVKIIHYGKSSSRQRRGAMFIQNYLSFYIYLKKHYSSFTYYAYRFRTFVYMEIWLFYFSVKFSIKKIFGKDCTEEKEQLKVYWQAFKWNLSSKSFVTLE